MSADLADFLLARIADDESVARTHLRTVEEEQDSPGGDPWTGEYGEFVNRGLDFVCAWSPARVLAECEAKRRIVDDALADVRDARRRPGWTVPDAEIDAKGRDYRTGFENAKAQLLPDALDRTERLLRLLAAPYADHDGYRQEWRP